MKFKALKFGKIKKFEILRNSALKNLTKLKSWKFWKTFEP